jgi:hypothetical protein
MDHLKGLERAETTKTLRQGQCLAKPAAVAAATAQFA